MPLRAIGSLVNIQRSLDAYFAAEFAAAYPIDWEGVPFDDAERPEWFQPRLLEPVRPPTQFYRQVSADDRGHALHLLYNVNIFCRPRLQASPYRLTELRDAVLGAFTERTRVAIRDYAGNLAGGTLGYAIVHEIATDRRIVDPALADELLQWNVTPMLRWQEGWYE